MKKPVSGFTLIELLVVISIISLLSSVVISSTNTVREKARRTATTQTILEYRKAILFAYDELGKFPEIVPGVPSSTCIGTFTDNACGWNNTLTPHVGVNTQIAKYIPGLPTITVTQANGSKWEGPMYSCYAINNGVCLARLEWFLEGAYEPCVIAGSSGIYTFFASQNISYCLLPVR